MLNSNNEVVGINSGA
ncbi:hypothetical protein [Staphylococcus simulans]